MAKKIELPKKYPVPDNWIWIEMGHVVKMKTGYPFESSKFSPEQSGRRPLIRIRDIVKGFTETFTDEDCPDEYVIHKGDVLIGMDGDFNIAKWEAEDALLNQRVCTIQSNKRVLLNDFMYYFLPDSLKKINDATPSVTVKHLSTKTLELIFIPIPPLAEQQRIVEQIENLFAKLDEAVEKVEAVRESYLARKSAILSQAFAGRLTETWRKKNGICTTWRECKFSDVAEIKSNLVEPSEYLDYPHIAPDNIEKKTGVLLPYNTIAEDKVTSGKHRFYAGQILYSKIRPYLSKVVTVDFDGLCSADMYPIEAKENTKYLWYYMLSDEFLEQASSAGSRSVLPKINQKELSKLIVKIPEMDEQEEIVKILDNLLPLEQRVMEQTDVVIEQIALMKKSILAKAFRGELGTNNPDEESVVELLKSILQMEA